MTTRTQTDRDKKLVASEFIWDIEGHTESHRFMAKPITQILKQSGAERILDLGCGNGAFTRLLKQAGYNIIGLDASTSGIEIACANSPDIEFRQYDLLEDLPVEYVGSFDAVISIEVIEHLLLPRKLIENAVSALKPNGLLIVTTPYHGYLKNLALAFTNTFDSHWHPLRDYGHIKFFSKRTLTDLLKEFDLQDLTYKTVGRIPIFARSMIMTGTKPQ